MLMPKGDRYVLLSKIKNSEKTVLFGRINYLCGHMNQQSNRHET